MTILDSLIYGFGTAFTSFCSSGGLNVLVTRIKDEVEYSLNLVKEAEASQMTGITSTSTSTCTGGKNDKGTTLCSIPFLNLLSTSLDSTADNHSVTDADEETSPIPFERTALLKAMFKFVIHMMQSPGTQEGLRNLIDTTLPSTLKAIMENQNALGTSVYAHGMFRMSIVSRFFFVPISTIPDCYSPSA